MNAECRMCVNMTRTTIYYSPSLSVSPHPSSPFPSSPLPSSPVSCTSAVTFPPAHILCQHGRPLLGPSEPSGNVVQEGAHRPVNMAATLLPSLKQWTIYKRGVLRGCTNQHSSGINVLIST